MVLTRKALLQVKKWRWCGGYFITSKLIQDARDALNCLASHNPWLRLLNNWHVKNYRRVLQINNTRQPHHVMFDTKLCSFILEWSAAVRMQAWWSQNTMYFLRFYLIIRFQLFWHNSYIFFFLINTTFQFVSFGIMSFIYHLKWSTWTNAMSCVQPW